MRVISRSGCRSLLAQWGNGGGPGEEEGDLTTSLNSILGNTPHFARPLLPLILSRLNRPLRRLSLDFFLQSRSLVRVRPVFLSDWRRRRGAGDANHENEPLNATTRSLGRFIFGRTGVQGAPGDRAGFVVAKTSAHVQDPGRPPCRATPSLSVCPARARQ